MDVGMFQGGVAGAGGALTLSVFYIKDLRAELARLRKKEDARVESGDKMTAQVIEALTMAVHLMGEVKESLDENRQLLERVERRFLSEGGGDEGR
jgi:hypothetical protein